MYFPTPLYLCSLSFSLCIRHVIHNSIYACVLCVGHCRTSNFTCYIASPRNKPFIIQAGGAIYGTYHRVFFVSLGAEAVMFLALLSSWTETMMYATRTRFAVNTATSAAAVVSPESARVTTRISHLNKRQDVPTHMYFRDTK